MSSTENEPNHTPKPEESSKPQWSEEVVELTTHIHNLQNPPKGKHFDINGHNNRAAQLNEMRRDLDGKLVEETMEKNLYVKDAIATPSEPTPMIPKKTALVVNALVGGALSYVGVKHNIPGMAGGGSLIAWSGVVEKVTGVSVNRSNRMGGGAALSAFGSEATVVGAAIAAQAAYQPQMEDAVDKTREIVARKAKTVYDKIETRYEKRITENKAKGKTK